MKKLIAILITFLIFGCSSSKRANFGSREVAQAHITGDCFSSVISILKETNYSDRRASFRRAVSREHTAKDKKAILAAIDSLYFVDYENSSKLLNKIYRGSEEIRKSKFPYLYNEIRYTRTGGRRKKIVEPAIENFVKGREFLDDEPEFSLETMLKLQKILMKGGVEEAEPRDLGKIRTGQWYGNEEYGGVTQSAFDEMNANPYLTFEVTRRVGERIEGKIWYPNLENVKDKALTRLPTDLRKRIRAAQRAGNVNDEVLERELLTALTEERFANFKKKRARIGTLTTPRRIEKYVELVAEFQRDLVSIHPLANGNGRTTREFGINYALMMEGLPPARVVDPSNDLYLSKEEWANEIKDGIINTVEMFKDFAYRQKVGLPLESSPFLAYPSYPKALSVNYKKYNSSKLTKDYTSHGVDINQYAQYFEQKYPRISQIPGMNDATEYESLDVKTMTEQFAEFYKKNHVLYKHKKEGDQMVELNFADREFRMTFGDRSYRNIDVFKRKMDRWYLDELNWRGLADTQDEMSEDEILTMFSSFHHQFLSNRVVDAVPNLNNQRQIRKEILEDFKKYNSDLYSHDGDLVRMAKDHSETGPLYYESYGYSTSKNRTVGLAFAMGAMVIADYGQQRAHQHLLKSRVLVGMKRAKKDVDLTRLKQVRPDFSYRYGRQQEVMGVGGTDPDAVTVVQTIDENGDVILSYVRNEENPSEVWVIKGEANTVKGVPRSKVLKKIDLPDEKPNFRLEASVLKLIYTLTA